MNLIDKIRQRAAGVHTEFLTNLSAPEYVNGLVENRRGCRLNESSKLTESNNMTTQIQAMKDETTSLRIQIVKKAAEVGEMIAANKRAAEKQENEKLNQEFYEATGIHMVDGE